MTIVTFGQYSFDTDDLRGRGFLTPYVINGVTYELETAMRVAAALDMADKTAKVGGIADTIAAAQSTVTLIWDAGTANADPVAGRLRASVAVLTGGGYSLYASVTDSAGASVASTFATMLAGTSAIKARARIVKIGDASKYVDVNISGGGSASGYCTFYCTYLVGPGGFTAGDAVALGWVRTGDKGDVGGASLPAGSAVAPGLAVVGDPNTGLAQLAGADTLSVVSDGVERTRFGATGSVTYGNVTAHSESNEWPVYSRYSGGGTGRSHVLTQKSRGTRLAPTAVQAGDVLGGVGVGAYDGTTYSGGWNGGVEITAVATQNWTGTARGTAVSLTTTPNNTIVPVERLNIGQDGVIAFGGAAKAKQAGIVYASTITLDFAAAQNFIIGDLTGPLTLGNPASYPVGQSGEIWFKQDGSGNHTVSAASAWIKMGPGIVALGAGKWTCFAYSCKVAGYIHYSIIGGA